MTTGQLASHVDELRKRGVSNPDEFAAHPAIVARALDWFDKQGGRVTAGVLVMELRKAIRREKHPATQTERQAQRGREIVAWLAENMPETFVTSTAVVEATRRTYGDSIADRLAASMGPHPAAVAALGRNGRDKRAIRAAIKAFDDRALGDLKAIDKDRARIGESNATEIRGKDA